MQIFVSKKSDLEMRLQMKFLIQEEFVFCISNYLLSAAYKHWQVSKLMENLEPFVKFKADDAVL